MSWVFEESPYDGVRRLIHLALADHANDQGVCWPGTVRIAAMARCKPDYVRQVIRQMIAAGDVVVLERGGGRGNRNVVQLVGPWNERDFLDPPRETGETPHGETGETPHAAEQTPQSTGTHAYLLNHQETHPPTPQGGMARAKDFDAFWTAWPAGHKVGKDAAKRAWATKCREKRLPELVAILEALERYVATDKVQRGIIVNPATWLNQGRWQDDVAAATAVELAEKPRPKCPGCGMLNPQPAMCIQGAQCEMRGVA